MPPKGSVLRKFVRGSVGSFALKCANQVLALVLSVILARQLEPDGFGVFSLALSIAMLAGVAVTFGLPNLLVRDIAKQDESGNRGQVRGLLIRAALIAIGIWAAIAILGALGMAFLPLALAAPLAIAFVARLFLTQTEIIGAALRALSSPLWGQIPQLIAHPLLTLALLAVLAAVLPLTPASALTAYALAALLSMIFSLVLLRPVAPSQHKQPGRTTASLARGAFPFALLAGMYLVNTNTDLVMLGFMGTYEDAGHYRVAVKGATLVLFALSAVNFYIAPQLARLHQNMDMAQLQGITRMSAWTVTVFSAVAFLVIWLFGEYLIALLFGDAYAPAYSALLILSAGNVVYSACGPVGTLLNTSGHERLTVRVMALAAILNVALNAALIPAFGIAGAAMATAATSMLWNVSLAVLVVQKLGINPTIVPLGHALDRRRPHEA